VPDGVPSGQLKKALAEDGPTGRFEWVHEKERYAAGYWTLFMRPTYLASWTLVQSERLGDVQQPLRRFAWTFSLIVLCTFWVVIFLSLHQIRRRMVPIEQLLEATHRLKAEDFSHRVEIASNDEFAELGTAFNDMTESMGVHLSVMNTINSIGVSLSAEKDEARLLETVLRGAQAVFNADGAALFLVSNDDRVELSLAHVKSLSWWAHGPLAAKGRESDAGGSPDLSGLQPPARAAEHTISTPDVYSADRGDFAPTIEFDRRIGYRSRSFVSVPLRNHENELIGILQLINAQSRSTARSCRSRTKTGGWRNRWPHKRRSRSPRTGWSTTSRGSSRG